MQAQQKSLNYQSLNSPVTYKQALSILMTDTKSIISIVFVVVFFIFFLVPPFLALVGAFFFSDVSIIFLIPFVLVALMALVVPVLIMNGLVSKNKQAIRLSRFAADNGLYFELSRSAKSAGVFSDLGSAQTYTNHIFGTYNAKTISISNYEYTIGSGDNSQTINVGIIEMLLPKALPNVVLDSKKNNYFGNDAIASQFSKSQKLSLEGDFDKYFTLYTPLNYQRDTLYFLTPELMELLINIGQDYDIEVVDNTLKLYRPNGVDFSEHGLSAVFSIIDSLGGEFIENTAHYKDERSAVAGIVAPAGARLKKSYIPMIIVQVITGIIALAVVWRFIY